MSWTDQDVVDLRRLFADGLSASQIAAEMGGGLSRCAIIGKLYRLGLCRGHTAAAPKKPRMSRARANVGLADAAVVRVLKPVVVREAPREVPQQVIDSDIPIEQRRTLFELRNETCRWPIGEPNEPGFFFCGATTADNERGHPYCPAHASIAFSGRGKAEGRGAIEMRLRAARRQGRISGSAAA